MLDLFSRTTVEQNGLKLWGSGAFFLPPQGMYYPVSNCYIFHEYRTFTGSYTSSATFNQTRGGRRLSLFPSLSTLSLLEMFEGVGSI